MNTNFSSGSLATTMIENASSNDSTIIPTVERWGQADFGLASDRGRVRQNNEDSCLASSLQAITGRGANELGYIFAVADGMGGAAAGEQASAFAIKELRHVVQSKFSRTPPLRRDSNWVRRQFTRSLERVDHQLILSGIADANVRGAGTTLTIGLALGPSLHIAHIGDSRAYLLRAGRLMRLTRDHTLAQRMLETGELTPEEAVQHRYRHILTNVIGSTVEGVDIDFLEINLLNNDQLLVCSDGLTEIVSENVIVGILSDCENCQEAADELISESLLQGAPDNVTAIVARFYLD